MSMNDDEEITIDAMIDKIRSVSKDGREYTNALMHAMSTMIEYISKNHLYANAEFGLVVFDRDNVDSLNFMSNADVDTVEAAFKSAVQQQRLMEAEPGGHA